MNTDRNWPFISKNTSISPLAVSSSEIASVLKANVLPFSMVTYKQQNILGI